MVVRNSVARDKIKNAFMVWPPELEMYQPAR
jgi:hypothetical protein